jgi:hypothetical protein
MKNNFFTIFTLASLVLGAIAHGAESEPKKKSGGGSRAYSTPFGLAGCGLGSIIIDSKDKKSQIAASLINTYIGFVSSAITSGTSNCNYNNNTAMTEQKVYVTANLRTLEKEAASGNGPHLSALAELFGCESSETKAAFGVFNKDDFSNLYNSDDPEKVWENLKNRGKSSNVASKCSGLS